MKTKQNTPKTSIEKQFFECTDLTKRPPKISEKYIVSIAIQTTTAYNLLNIFDRLKLFPKTMYSKRDVKNKF